MLHVLLMLAPHFLLQEVEIDELSQLIYQMS